MKEIEIGSLVKKYFEDRGWGVWSEVSHGNRVADMVAVRLPLTAVVECKTTLNFNLLEQAENWIRKNISHLVYIAIPHSSGGGRDFVYRICKHMGIGVILVNKRSGYVYEKIVPKIWRKAKPKFDLVDAQKDSVPGTFGGGHHTPWKRSISLLKDELKRNGPTDILKAIKSIKHHWSKDSVAKHCLLVQIRSGIISGIRLENGKLVYSE